MKFRYILIMCAAAWSAGSVAQDLTTEITVERDIDTTLPAAEPLEAAFPQMPPLPQAPMALYPTQYSGVSHFDATAAPLAPASVTLFPVPDGYRGYIFGGYFPVYNATATAGYSILESKNTSLAVAARYNGENYKNAGQGRVSDNTLGAVAHLRQNISDGISLTAKADYFHSWLKTPGMNTVNQYGIDGASFAADVRSAQKIGWHAGVRYSYMGTNAPFYAGTPADNRFIALGGVLVPLTGASASMFMVDAKADVLHNTKTQSIITAIPAFCFNLKNLTIKAGVRFDIGTGSSNGAYHVAPDVRLMWKPSQIVEAYGIFSGGERYFTLSDQYAITPYAIGAIAATLRSYAPVDGSVGINVRPAEGLALSADGGYVVTRRDAMLSYNPLTDYADFTAVNTTGWHVGAKITYAYRRLVEVEAACRFFPTGVGHATPENFADRARYTSALKVDVHPIDHLTVGASWHMRADRKYYLGTEPGATAVDMGAINDLGINASYALRDNFTVFLRLDNILNRRALLLPTLSEQGFHGLAGIDWRF